MSDVHERIAEIEEAIEETAEAARRCGKTVLVSKVAAAGGLAMLAAALLGIVRLEAPALVFGLAALLGGIAAYGSNASTLDELRARIRDLETRRDALINGLDLHTVAGRVTG